SIVAVLTAASLAAVQVPSFIATDAVDSMHQPITPLQANIAVGQADADGVVSVVAGEHVDILTVSELTVPALHRLQTAGLQAELPYWVLDPRGGGAGGGIWSRFPLTNYTAHPQFTVLIAGDFNATNDNVQFRDLLRGGLVDARQAVGAGLVPTFPSDRAVPPILAIDHDLVEGVRADAVKAVDLPGSDHRGLLVRVTVP
ncbi:MAG: endonuclease/exonuclease/phosphatase family protein, partial [Rhodococcus sp. (in: high G+C Gram-positive bacteria)]